MGPLAIMAISGAVGGLAKIGMGLAGRGARREELRKAQQEFDLEKQRYRDLEIKNPFEDMQRNFENTFEDLTVNTQAAEFQNRMFQQSQADMMQGLQRSAGGSGIASLAQALANQSMQQSAAVSAQLGKQEAANQLAMAKGGMMEQQMEMQADIAYGKGAAQQQSMEMTRQGTLLGMGAQRLGAAKQDIAAHKAMVAGGIGEVAGSVASGYAAGYDPTTGKFSKEIFMGQK
tara:strand:- start:384 stop:1076 length:693 start_codon:yes stop_codon:yes gene_type:complete